MTTQTHNIIDPTSFTSIIRNPTAPVCCPIPNGNLQLGTLITIYGAIHSNGRGFRIDFLLNECRHAEGLDPMAPIAFHFNPRINSPDVVVMNSFSNGIWENEIRNSESFPFSSSNPFRLMILVEESSFKIAVDGKHMYEFAHRVPFELITRMHIEGNLDIDLIEFRKELKYLFNASGDGETFMPDITEIKPSNELAYNLDMVDSRSVTSPTIPYLENDPKLSQPCDIYISGMLPNHIREHMVINLASYAVEPNTADNVNIPVHISIRADLNTIVRNTMTNGVWGEEELYLEAPNQLIPGTHFDLMISNRKDKVIVAINGQPSFEYNHRHDPTTISSLQILGGIVLTSVRFDYKN